jgi:hypothetical protein
MLIHTSGQTESQYDIPFATRLLNLQCRTPRKTIKENNLLELPVASHSFLLLQCHASATTHILDER